MFSRMGKGHVQLSWSHPGLKQESLRPSVICLTKCTFFGLAYQVNLCTWIGIETHLYLN